MDLIYVGLIIMLALAAWGFLKLCERV